MSQYSTDTLLVRSKSYQDTCEAYLPSLFPHSSINDFFPGHSYDPICQSAQLEDLGNFIAFHYLITRGNPNNDKLLSFLIKNSLHEHDCKFLTVPITDDDSSTLRVFASAQYSNRIEKPYEQEQSLNNSKTDWIELEILNSLYDKIAFKEWDKIKIFIEERKFLSQVIVNSIYIVQKIFGENTKIEYQMEYDLEANESEKLMGYILTEIESEKALDLLDIFDTEWYFKQNYNIKNSISFNIVNL